MVFPIGDHKLTLRPAHFLNPSVTFTDEPIFELPSLFSSSLPPTFEPSKWPLKLTFNSWPWKPPRNWKTWVDSLRPKFQSLWKKAGIFEAIMNSTYVIRKSNDLVIGIAERWCSKTRTFIFPWAEATLTLEDTMVLGGFSVLGHSVYISIESQELKEIEDKLIQARVETGRSKARKASPSEWLKLFINSGSEIEHEAFLVMWLYKSDFPRFYREKERWVPVDPNLDEEIEAFARCMRVSQLVGLGCIEEYFPHRVAMQFGMDQDLPGCVTQCKKTPEIAWNNYSKPISDVKLYVPSRLSEIGVTSHYLK
nr:hypothetical protein CFP56_57314 [Quercus suber]